jgi:hypothetical protein
MPNDIQQFSARRSDLLLSGKESFTVHTETVFKEKHGVRDTMPELTITHLIS